MQRHFHRSELWCFLTGYGVFRHNENICDAPKGGFKNVNVGDWHQYKALSSTLVLEIQTGDCREEDIERK